MNEVPSAAALVRDVVNTYEPQTGGESWRDPSALRAWLVERDLVSGEVAVDEGQLDAARTLREGLRELLLEHAGHGSDPDRTGRLRAVLDAAAPRLRLGADGIEVRPGSDRAVDGLVAQLVDAVRRCQVDGTWQRLKACERESCQWAYFDGSRNRSRRWCSMEGCGNLLKMRRRAGRSRG